MIISHGKLLAILIILLPISYTVDGFLSYYDEIFVLGYFIYGALKQITRFKRNDKVTLFLIFIYYSLGLVSNYYSHLIFNEFAIFVDAFTVYKQFLIYLILKNILTNKDRIIFLKTLLPVVKFYIILAFFLESYLNL